MLLIYQNLVLVSMWKGEDYLTSNPDVIKRALDHYCKKLEHLKKEDPLNPTVFPEIFPVGLDNFVKRIRKMQGILNSGNINEIHTLEDYVDFIRSALKKYKNDVQNCLTKITDGFGEDVPKHNDFTKEMDEVDKALEGMNRL